MVALRVRQVVAAVRDLPSAVAQAESAGLPFVYQDPDVGYFGAVNSLHAVGDTFLELLAERDVGSAVGRHLDRLGGDGGYMVIVQVDDLDVHLERVADLGIRVIWTGGHSGIRGAHLHPADVGGAILSLDEVEPREAWPWCGPSWTGGVPAVPTPGSSIAGIVLTASDPDVAASRWADVFGVEAEGRAVACGSTVVSFVPSDDRPDRLVEVRVPGGPSADIGGLRFSGPPAASRADGYSPSVDRASDRQ